MALFFLDLLERETILADEEGMQFSSLETAVQEAIRLATDVAKDSFLDGANCVAVDIRQGRERLVRITVEMKKELSDRLRATSVPDR
jgi:hypothetical protein